ncbi:MAG: hypothetical protein HYX78_15520 [Armatimonadetes bacterium]|nr:hypothetical protein [Armatimonadota bacterium]
MNHYEAQRIWLEAVERVKDRTLAPTLWRALEAGSGVIDDGDTFVIGFPPSDSPMRGYLMSSEHRTTIEKALTELVGRPMTIAVIEGTTEGDYAAHVKREEVAEATRRASMERKHVERMAERKWEAVMEQCSRRFAKLHLRQLPQVRAQFIFETVRIISDAMDQIHSGDEMDEIGMRAMARTIEKVATITDTPSSVIAMELVKYRSQKGSGK